MKPWIHCLISLFSAASLQSANIEQPAPRVFLLKPEFLLHVKTHLSDPVYAKPFAELKKDAENDLSSPLYTVVDEFTPESGDKHDYMSQAPYFWRNPDTPNGLPYIRKDGQRNPEINKLPDHRTMDAMVNASETLALAWFFTGEEKFAAKAVELVRAWFLNPETRMNPNLQYAQAIPGINTGRGIGLIEPRSFTRLVDAVGLLHGSKSWSAEDQKALRAWFNQFLTWMLESKNGRDERAALNNHGTYYDLQAASYALFAGRRDVAEEIFREAGAKRIAKQIEPDGKQPLELARTTSWGYSVGNLQGLFSLALLAENSGVYLWRFETPDGRSLRKALDYLIPYALKEAPWPHQQIRGFSPDGVHSMIRLAAAKFPNSKYSDLATRIPAVPETSRSLLTQAHLATKLTSESAKVRVLVVTGGHGFPREPFFKMLGSITNITYTHAEHGKTNATVFDRDDLSNYDALLLYDMPREITAAQKSKFLSLLQRGTGLLVLHHALVSHQHWPDYERIIGGRYPEEDGKGGVITKEVGYEHDVDLLIKIADRNHPVTKGLSDFTTHDEIYWGYRIGKDVVPLLTTTHPKSGNPIVWARQEQNSRVVFIQPGHGPQVFEHPEYRRLLAQSLAWIAKK